MNIDERKKQLQAELAALEKVEAILNDPAAKKLLMETMGGKPESAPAAPIPPPPAPDRQDGRKERHLEHIGARRAVIMALHTGSAKLSDLSSALVWKEPFLRTIVGPMVRKGLLYFVETTGVYGLTERGKEHATYYLEHPKAKVYGKYLPSNLPNRTGAIQ